MNSQINKIKSLSSYSLFLLPLNVFLAFLLSMACRSLLPSRLGGIRFGVPLQKLHPLSRAIHHRYSNNNNPPQRPPQRHYTSLSRLPMRPRRSRSGHGYYQQHRSFWVARLAARLLKLRYILLGSAVGGGYTAKKVLRIFTCLLPVSGCVNTFLLSLDISCCCL